MTRNVFLVGLISLAFTVPAIAEETGPLHPAIGQKLVPADVNWEQPIYASAFDDAAALADWRLEGGKAASIAGGKLVLESHDEGIPADNRNHLVCWLAREFPADFLLEFSVRPRSRKDGLNIVFFNARGVQGESIFDPALAKRDGLFAQYHSGDLKNYHISYWASSLEKGPRVDANLRKNPGFQLVSVGKDLITEGQPDAFQTVRLYKRGGTIRLMVDDIVSVAFDDDGQKFGPVWNHAGWIGLRQMGRTVRCEYDHFKVFALKAKPDYVAGTWPLPHMQHLPPDYLKRLHASIRAGAGRMDRLKLADSQASDSIGWARYGLNSLMLGERADEINRFFESDTFAWSANPKFGFSLFSVSFMRLYGLTNHRTGPLKGALSPKAVANLEEEMWKVAKANSKLAEAKRHVWEMEGSENHHLASKTCDFLAAQYLRNLPTYADQKYDDGSTLAEQYEVRRAYFLKWLDERAKRGQFVEAASPSYQGDSVNALMSLRDFAEDPVLRRKAEMYLDLTYAVIAEETLLTTRGGPKSRVKVGHEYDGGMAYRAYDLLFDAPGRTYEPRGEGGLATSDYYPPPVVVNLARDTTGRGAYSFATRWPGPVGEGGGRSTDDPDGILWRTLDPERSVLRKGFATPSYVLGSAALDARWLDDASMGFRWQGVVFASDLLARIGFEVKPKNTNDWHGFNPFFSVQDRNVLITQRWAPVPPNPRTALPAYLRVYFSPTLDELHEEGGWIFVKDGDAFAALKVVHGGYAWEPAWQHAETVTGDNKAFITLEKEHSPVILVVNQAADYANDFMAFKAAAKSAPIQYQDGALRFATLTFHGPAKPAEINGQPENLARPRGYDSPFVRSDWNSGLIYIRKGNETAILDFRDSANPKKTIGAPVTPEFPPGVGTEKPIILGK
jgi:hypothetical protein